MQYSLVAHQAGLWALSSSSYAPYLLLACAAQAGAQTSAAFLSNEQVISFASGAAKQWMNTSVNSFLDASINNTQSSMELIVDSKEDAFSSPEMAARMKKWKDLNAIKEGFNEKNFTDAFEMAAWIKNNVAPVVDSEDITHIVFASPLLLLVVTTVTAIVFGRKTLTKEEFKKGLDKGQKVFDVVDVKDVSGLLKNASDLLVEGGVSLSQGDGIVKEAGDTATSAVAVE